MMMLPSSVGRESGNRAPSSNRFVFGATIALSVMAPMVALASNDPFAQPATSPEAKPPIEVVQNVASTLAGCDHVTRELCGKSNTALLASALGYVVVSVLVFSIFRVWWNRRGTASAGTRFFIPLFLAATVAGVLVALDPARGQDLQCCLAHGVFKAEVLLQDSTAGRTAVFGVLPTAVLYTGVAFISRILRG